MRVDVDEPRGQHESGAVDHGIRAVRAPSVTRAASRHDTAVERDAVNLADKINDDLVALSRLVALFRVFIASLRRSELLQLLVHRFFVGLDGQALKLQAINLRGRNVGQGF